MSTRSVALAIVVGTALLSAGFTRLASAVSVGEADPFNVFIINDIGGPRAGEGFVGAFGGIAASGGDMFLQSFTANSSGQASQFGLYAGEDITFDGGTINGGFTSTKNTVINQAVVFGDSSVGGHFTANDSTIYGPNPPAIGTLSIPKAANATLNNSSANILVAPYVSPLDYNAIGASLKTASQNFDSLVPTGTVIPVCDNTGCSLFINGVSGQNVFDLDLKGFAKPVKVVNFGGPSDATFILDLVGASIKMKGIGFNLGNGVNFTDILWNTSSASDVTLDQIVLPGTLLAPSADVDLTNGGINGNLYAFNLEGNGQTNTVPEPGSWILLLTGLTSLAAGRLRRTGSATT